MKEMEHDVLSDPAFVRLVAEREAAVAKELLNLKVAHLGVIFQMFRENAGLTRAQLSEQSGVPVEIIFLLERQLMPFDELTLELLEALARPLRLNAFILVSAGEFNLAEIKSDPNVAYKGTNPDPDPDSDG